MPPLSCPDEHDLLALLHGDPAAAAVEAHLSTCAACSAKFRSLRAEMATLRSVNSKLATAPAAKGEAAGGRPAFIGKYFIAGVIDEDAETISYRAVHGLLHQEVVVTAARRPVPAETAARQPWFNAARRLVEFQQPGMGRMFDFDFFDDRPFVVTEYDRGTKLSALPAAERFTPLEAASAMLPIAAGVVAAHAAGIAHGAIGPAAIMLTNDGKVKLTSPGLTWFRRRLTDDSGTIGDRSRDEARPMAADVTGLSAALAALGGNQSISSASAQQFARELANFVEGPRRRRQMAIVAVVASMALLLVALAARQLGWF